MDDDTIRAKVHQAYFKKYPKWKNIEVGAIKGFLFGGYLVAVTADEVKKKKAKYPQESKHNDVEEDIGENQKNECDAETGNRKKEKTSKQDEMCYVTRQGYVHIFGTTNELVAEISSRSSLPNWLMEGRGIAAIAFLALIAFFIYVSLNGDHGAAPNAEHTAVLIGDHSAVWREPKSTMAGLAFDSLKTILGLAAGVFLAKRD